MTDSAKPSGTKPRPRVRRRRWRWLLAVAVLLLILVALAPTIASSLLLDQILARVSQEVNGRIVAERASFGWFSPIELHGFKAHGTSGEPIFSMDRLRTEKSLWRVLINPEAIGTIHAEAPTLRVVTRSGGSNLEDFLEPLLARPAEKKPLEIGWNVSDARIEFYSDDPPINSDPVAVYVIPKFTGSFQRKQRQAWEAVGQIHVTARDQSGSLQIDTRGSGINTEGKFDLQSGTATVDATIDKIPITALQPIISRFTSDVVAHGILTGRLHADLKDGQAKIIWNDLGSQQNRIFVAALSPDEPVICEQFQSSGQLHWNGDEIKIDSSLVSDFGTANLKVTSLAAGDSAAILRILSAGNVDLKANLDLKRLAGVLPDRMGLRDDVTITSGSVDITLRGQPQASETLWTASVLTGDLAGRRGTTEIVWPEPIRANLKARWARGRLAVDDLECRSEFLTANLKGTADDGEVQLHGDLQRLAERMKQFFEIPANFAGKLDGQLRFTRRPPELLLDGELTASDFIWHVSETHQLVEPVMVLSGQTTLRQDAQQRLQEVSTGSLHLVAGDDTLRLDLKQPVEVQAPDATIPVALTLKGNLAQWKSRLETFVDLEAWSVSGLCDATGTVSVKGNIVDIQQFQAEIHDLIVAGEGVQIDEPVVTVDIAGQWNGDEKKWITTRGEFRTSAIAASGDDVQLLLGDTPAASGKLMVRADLSRIQNWLVPKQATPPRLRFAGEFIGDAYLDHQASTTLLQLDGTVEAFELTQPRPQASAIPVASATAPGSPLWHEKEAKFSATARWRREGTLELQSARLSGEGWMISGKGGLTGLPSKPAIQLEGTADYNWKSLAPRLRITAGNTLSIAGERHDPLKLEGPLLTSGAGLVSPDLHASGAIGWDSAAFQGVAIGAGEMRTELKDSVLQFSLLEVPVSEGMLSLAPRVDLRSAPARLEIPPGTILKDVRISPTMCRTWLKYALPVLADVPKAEGSFDLQLEHVEVPLDFPQNASVKGQIVLHEAVLGAGPLTEVILRVSDAVSALADRNPRLNQLAGGTWIEVPAQVVEFEMIDGRVIHRELQLNAKGVTIYTRGSMGVDQTYDLLVEVPIPKSSDPNARLAALTGRTYRIPLRGKLGEPLEVGPLLTELAKQIAIDSAGAAAEGLLEEGLNFLRNR